MTFPAVASGLDVELDIGGTWTSVVSRMDHGPLEIARGHPDESVTVSPSTLALTLTNGDGALSLENAMSAYYPYLSQNVPCRVSLPAQQNYMRIEDDNTSAATCPTSSGLNITGDIDLRVDMDFSGYQRDYLGNPVAVMLAKVGADESWFFHWGPAGLRFGWYDGSEEWIADSVIAPPYRGRQCLRATLTVATGTVTFYTGPAGGCTGATWTQLGSTVSPTSGASTSIATSTADVSAGNFSSGHMLAASACGAYYEAAVYSGIAGTLKAHPVFSSQSAGTTSFADAESNTWTLYGTAEISSRLYRGYFEIAELPAEEPPYNPAADESAGETDVLSSFVGGGLLRRLSQRNRPLDSPMYRAWVRANASLLAAYWPMEDAAGATRFASGTGGRPMYWSGTPTLASSSDFACSSALPAINGASTSGQVNYSGTWTDNQVAFLMEVPAAGDENGSIIAQVATTGSIAKLALSYGTGGTLTLAGYDGSGSQVFTSGAVAFGVNGQQMLIAIALQDSPGGGTMTYHVDGFTTAGVLGGTSATFSGSIGAVTSVQLNPFGSLGLIGTVLGHCAVLTEYQQLYNLFTYTNPLGLLTGALLAWAGEPAAVRFARLCAEEGVPYRITGAMNGTMLMGIQSAETLTQLLQECADADRGVWYELRQALGWGYVCRPALYNQAAQVTADYASDFLSPWKSPPTRDDQVIVNDVTLTQANTATTSAAGSSSRAYAAPGQPVTGGRLSTLTPADGGCGTYDQAFNVNAWRASDLDNIATWIVGIGTADRRRFPGITLDLANSALSTDDFQSALALDLGQMIEIVNPPPWFGYDPVTQLAQQLTETLDAFTMEIAVAGVPEQPYEVATAGTARADTAGSQLHTGYSSSATSMQVDVTAGNLWITTAAFPSMFPFDINVSGERITVTAISGTSSPQTFTVTRAVNGVSKAQASAAPVSLWNTPVAAL